MRRSAILAIFALALGVSACSYYDDYAAAKASALRLAPVQGR
jgi:hypothetical protein